MNIQQLRYVVAIANSGTFREAAEKMYVSQPSLSMHICGVHCPADAGCPMLLGTFGLSENKGSRWYRQGYGSG